MTSAMTLPTTVTTRRGKIVRDLVADDFRLFEEGEERGREWPHRTGRCRRHVRFSNRCIGFGLVFFAVDGE